MAILGIENINIGAQNEAAGSDSLYIAFNKSKNNFTTLFSCASPTTNFVAGNGISVEYSNSNTYLTITNTGVTSLTAGDSSIVLTQSNGNITITAPGGGNGGGGVSNINVIGAAAGARITSTGGPVISSGIITLDLANSGVVAGTYTYPTVTVDQYGRVTSIANATSAGTVTSVGVTTTGAGIQISGSPVTTAGNISIINTGVTRLNAGSGISLSSSNGNITISTSAASTGVTSVGISSTSLDVTNSPITSTGTMTVDLPTNTSIIGNLTVGNNLTVTGNAVVTGNLTVQGNTTYYNVETFNVEDPIISLGGGPNGNALTSNDGKDRGTALQYYTSTPVTAFMGWDNGNSEFSFGSNVTIASEVVTYNTLGNARGLTWLGNVVGTTANLTTGNMTTGNITTINSSLMQNGNSNVSITANANVSIAVASSNRLVVTSTGANITGTANISGNLSAGNIPIIASGNSNITITSNANISMFTAGNATAQFVVTSTGANITGTANVVGNLISGNLTTTTSVITTGNITTINSGLIQNSTSNITITSAGNVTITATGNAVMTVANTGANITGYANAYSIGSTQIGTPATPSGVGSTSGGSLAAATYFFKIVAVDGFGQVTAPSAESTGVTTTGATSSIVVSWTATTAAVSYRIYFATTTNTYTLGYFTSTTNSYSFTTTAGSTSGTIPVNNTTGSITASGFLLASALTGISAAGTVQANATALTKEINIVTGVGPGQGVVLPQPAAVGMRVFVRNAQAANALLVYPGVNGFINLGAANAAFSLALSTGNTFLCASPFPAPGGIWYTAS